MATYNNAITGTTKIDFSSTSATTHTLYTVPANTIAEVSFTEIIIDSSDNLRIAGSGGSGAFTYGTVSFAAATSYYSSGKILLAGDTITIQIAGGSAGSSMIARIVEKAVS